jgi:hypothetical protein
MGGATRGLDEPSRLASSHRAEHFGNLHREISIARMDPRR